MAWATDARVPVTCGGGVGEEGQELLVDLARVGHAHDVGSAVDLDVAGGGQGRVEATPLALDGEDAVRRAVQDQGRDVHVREVGGVVVEPGRDAGPRRVRGRLGPGVPQRADGVLADPLAEVVVEVEEVPDQPAEPREPVVEDALLDAGDGLRVDALGVLVGLGERRGQALDEHDAAEAVGAVAAHVPGQFAGAEREPDEGDVAQVELGQQPVEVGGEGVEVVAHGGPARPPEAAPVVVDHSVAGGEQGVQLRFPRSAVERPAVDQHDRSPAPLVLVVEVDRGAVLLAHGDRAHPELLCSVASPGPSWGREGLVPSIGRGGEAHISHLSMGVDDDGSRERSVDRCAVRPAVVGWALPRREVHTGPRS